MTPSPATSMAQVSVCGQNTVRISVRGGRLRQDGWYRDELSGFRSLSSGVDSWSLKRHDAFGEKAFAKLPIFGSDP